MSRFRKSERLHGKKCISFLFEKGNVFHTNSLRIIWVNSQSISEFQARMAVTVPKKIFNKAVSRNILKRRIREIYRKHKEDFFSDLNSANMNIDFIILYNTGTILKSSEIEPEIILTLQRLVKESKGKGKKG